MTKRNFPSSKLVCPACQNPTRRKNNGKCLHCNVDLELFTYSDDNGKLVREFRLPHPQQAQEVVIAQKAGATLVDVGGRLLTPEGSNPEIVLQLKEGKKHYRVTYRYDIPVSWLYCPDCGSRMFQNMIINSVHLEQEHFCAHCKSWVVFVFISHPYYHR